MIFGLILVGLILSGFLIGKIAHKFLQDAKLKTFSFAITLCQNISIFVLLFMMGYKIGSNKELVAGFSTIGIHSVLFGISAMLGSSLVTWLFISIAKKTHMKRKNKKLNSHVPFSVDDNKSSQKHNILMIFVFLGLVILGGILGYFNGFIIGEIILANLVDASLMALVFFIGIDMGLSQLTLDHLLSIGKSTVIICIGVVIGSLLGALSIGILLGYNAVFSLAVGCPMGWYSLAGIVLSKLDAQLGAMAFSANLVRELMAIAFVPLIGSTMAKESAIAACGATAMDTTLPAITKGIGRQYAVTGFACGIILSFIVPFFLFIIQIIYGIM